MEGIRRPRNRHVRTAQTAVARLRRKRSTPYKNHPVHSTECFAIFKAARELDPTNKRHKHLVDIITYVYRTSELDELPSMIGVEQRNETLSSWLKRDDSLQDARRPDAGRPTCVCGWLKSSHYNSPIPCNVALGRFIFSVYIFTQRRNERKEKSLIDDP